MQKPAVHLVPEEVISIEPDQPVPCHPAGLRPGDTCPACETATLDYNGLLALACPSCGYSQGGGFT